MSLTPVSDTWNSRDLPVLAALVALWDATGQAQSWDIVERTGLDHDVVDRAGQALRDDGLIDASFIDAAGFIVSHISGDARRTVGSWPTPETAIDRLIAALEQAVADAPDEEERSRRQRALDGLRGISRDLLVNAGGAMLGGLAGGSAA